MLTPEEYVARRSDDGLRRLVVAGRVRRVEDGVELEFVDAALLPEIVDFIAFERRCCPFFRFDLAFEPGPGPIRLRISGPPGVDTILADLLT